MTNRKNQVAQITFTIDTPLIDVVAAIDRAGLGLALLADDNGRLLRTVTDGDIRRAMIADIPLSSPAAVLLARVVGGSDPGPVTAAQGAAKAELLHLMQSRKIRHLPLLDRERRAVEVVLLADLIEEVEPPLQAVVMAGGFGTRLHPLTETVPKPMLPIGDKPIIEYIVRQMQLSGIRRIDVATHYLADQIKAHLRDGSEFGVEINYVTERQPLGTAGALSLIPRPGKTTLLMNGDILTRVDFRAMHEFHRDNDAELTMALCPYDLKIPYGVVECAGNMVTGLEEKPTLRHMVNAGIYLLEDSVYELIPSQRVTNMTTVIHRLLRAGRKVAAFPIREYWLDIGQHADYLRAQEDARGGRLAPTEGSLAAYEAAEPVA